LSRPDPFICLIKGQWGVGKTFFIRKFVREHRAEIVKTNFSYVSLFGIASIDELMGGLRGAAGMRLSENLTIILRMIF
jgi:hypothetical protein